MPSGSSVSFLPPVRNYNDFLTLRNKWDEVYQNSSIHSHYLTFEFVDLWYRCFAEPDQVRVYLAVDKGLIIAILPLVHTRAKGIRFISNLTHEHCMHAGPLVRKGYESTYSELLLRELHLDCSSWDILRDNYSYSFLKFSGLFQDDILKKNKFRWLRNTERTYAIDLNFSYDYYLMNYISGKTRHNYSTRKNKCVKCGPYSIRLLQGKDAIAHWPLFLDIENSGWKGNAGSSIKCLGKNYQTYYEGLLRILEGRGELRLYFFELNGKAIAGLFGYIENNIFHDWKVGYLEEYKDFAPSHMLFFECVKQIFETQPNIKKFHMFPIDYGYKSRFVMNNPDYFLDTLIFSKTLKGIAAYYYLNFKKRQCGNKQQ